MRSVHATFALLALLAIVALPLMAGTGCGADEEIKQGIAGEFCNGSDLDCRTGLVCLNRTCVDPGIDAEVDCEAMCARLQSCEAPQPNCLAQCEATIGGTCVDVPCPWSGAAVDAFGACLIEGLSCEEARRDDAPSLCYSRIPIDSDRENLCQDFIGAASNCGASSTEALRQRCYLLGRTTSPASWTRTEACVARIEAGICENIAACLNEIFELTPPLTVSEAPEGDTPPAPVNISPL